MKPTSTPLDGQQLKLLGLIEEELQRKPVPVNKYRKKSGLGRSMTLGIVNRRCLPPDISRESWKRPYLHFLLQEFGKTIGISYTSITVNQNYETKPHYDSNNVGTSYIVGFGLYDGGDLHVEPHGSFNIAAEGVLFNGAESLHWTAPFQGDRYSLVFYTALKAPAKTYMALPIPSTLKTHQCYSAVGYGIYSQNSHITGLPHPLKCA